MFRNDCPMISGQENSFFFQARAVNKMLWNQMTKSVNNTIINPIRVSIDERSALGFTASDLYKLETTY